MHLTAGERLHSLLLGEVIRATEEVLIENAHVRTCCFADLGKGNAAQDKEEKKT